MWGIQYRIISRKQVPISIPHISAHPTRHSLIKCLWCIDISPYTGAASSYTPGWWNVCADVSLPRIQFPRHSPSRRFKAWSIEILIMITGTPLQNSIKFPSNLDFKGSGQTSDYRSITTLISPYHGTLITPHEESIRSFCILFTWNRRLDKMPSNLAVTRFERFEVYIVALVCFLQSSWRRLPSLAKRTVAAADGVSSPATGFQATHSLQYYRPRHTKNPFKSHFNLLINSFNIQFK